MPGLREIQQAFAEGVIEGRDQGAVAMIAPERTALRSLALYRRLIRTNYTQVLKVTYPIVSRLVGERDFGILAKGYLRRHPSTSGDLFPYGRHLPTFLRSIEAPVLLVEMARLEWACHEVHEAADSPTLSEMQLRAIASVNPSRVTAQLCAASRLLLFPFPVYRVWLALQPDAQITTDLDLSLPEEETGVIVTRVAGKVQVSSLNTLGFRLLEAMSRGVDLASIEQMVVDADPEFDLSRFVTDLLKQPIITGFAVRDAR